MWPAAPAVYLIKAPQQGAKTYLRAAKDKIEVSSSDNERRCKHWLKLYEIILRHNDFTAPACMWLEENRDALEVNQLYLSCDRGGLPWRDEVAGRYHHTRRSSYKLIPSNNNLCPHLLQHALPSTRNQPANSFRSELWGGGEGQGVCGLSVLIVMLCNWQVCVNPVCDTNITPPISHCVWTTNASASRNMKIHAKMTRPFSDDWVIYLVKHTLRAANQWFHHVWTKDNMSCPGTFCQVCAAILVEYTSTPHLI